MDSKIISFANFKGGVGKTSTTALVSYNLAEMGYKCLTIDFDAQANLTSLLLKTKANENDVITIKTTLMSALKDNKDLKDVIIKISDNLDLIPNAVDFSVYPRFLENEFTKEIDRVSFMKNKIEPLKADYDFIFIDVPPTLSLLNDTAFYACDDIVIVLQTQERSLAGAEVFLDYLQETLVSDFKAEVDVLGVLPVLSKKGARVDEVVLSEAAKLFGDEYIFDNKISLMERVKRMDMVGITNNKKDVHDRNVHLFFSKVAVELIERLEREENGYAE